MPKYIWVIQRECTNDLELRSLHALVKEKVNEVNRNVQGKLGEMDQKIETITKMLKGLEERSNGAEARSVSGATGPNEKS